MTKCDEILERIKQRSGSENPKDILDAQGWLDEALELEANISDETSKLETLRLFIARKKLEIMKSQEKKNVAAAELEVSVLPEFLEMKNQEHKVEQIKELGKLAKKNAELNRI